VKSLYLAETCCTVGVMWSNQEVSVSYVAAIGHEDSCHKYLTLLPTVSFDGSFTNDLDGASFVT
jgi:hypothetical protein